MTADVDWSTFFMPKTDPGGDDGWEDIPLPKSLTAVPPPLRDDALIGIVGEVARATVDLVGCDRLSPVLHLLAFWGALAPQGVREAILGQPARDFVLIVGDTGRSRKGTTYGAISRLLRRVDEDLGQRVISWQGGSGEGLIARLADGPYERRALLFSDEFGQVLAQSQRSGTTLMASIRTLWNPEGSADIPTRRDPVHVEGAHLAAILHATPEEVQRGFRMGEVTNGTINRILVARIREAEYRESSGKYPDEVFQRLTERLAEFAETAERAAQREAGPTMMEYTPEALTLWRRVSPSLDAPGPGANVLARGSGHVARLALLYASIEGKPEIDEEDLRAALAVWDACRQSAVLLFGAITGDPSADRVYSILVQHGREMTRTDLSNALGRHSKSSDIEGALVTLHARGLIRRRRQKTEGRSAERIDIISHGLKPLH